MTLFPVSGPSMASAPSSVDDCADEQGAIFFVRSSAVYDSHSHAQAAQASYARRFKPLKLKQALAGPKWPTNSTGKLSLAGLLKAPVTYMGH
jgi:hypothetical protein